MTAAFIACGIDPKKHIVFNQSQVAEHAELAWVFNCVARLGWLNRMTQFKEKAGKDRENASVGLYAYPNLMAADILVYRATHVPVGEDQKQHLELARDIAQKFNNDYGASIRAHGFGDAFFPQPEPLIQGPATRVMSLRDGSKKMSKSDPSDQSRINLTDDADAIALKIRRAKTDPEPLPHDEKALEARPEADNLVGIYAALAGTTKAEVLEAIRRRAVLGVQAGAGRPAGREAFADHRRDAAAEGRHRLYRFGAGRRLGPRAGARRRNHESRQGHRRLRAAIDSFNCRENRAKNSAAGCRALVPRPNAVAPLRVASRGPLNMSTTRRRRSYEAGHKPKWLVVIDDTAECDRAVYFAARRAARVGAGVIMLRVIETHDRNQQWIGVADIMKAEAHEEANAALDKYATRANGIAGITPERVVREGETADEILGLIEDDEDIAILVLAAGTGKDGPGRWSRASAAPPATIRSRSPSCRGI